MGGMLNWEVFEQFLKENAMPRNTDEKPLHEIFRDWLKTPDKTATVNGVTSDTATEAEKRQTHTLNQLCAFTELIRLAGTSDVETIVAQYSKLKDQIKHVNYKYAEDPLVAAIKEQVTVALKEENVLLRQASKKLAETQERYEHAVSALKNNNHDSFNRIIAQNITMIGIGDKIRDNTETLKSVIAYQAEKTERIDKRLIPIEKALKLKIPKIGRPKGAKNKKQENQ